MTRLIILLLVALAAWQASIKYPALLDRHRKNEVVIQNDGDLAISRVRLVAGDKTYVREVLVPGASAKFHLDIEHEVRLKLVWFGARRAQESEWSGPLVQPGRNVERHTLLVHDDGSVSHQAQILSAR